MKFKVSLAAARSRRFTMLQKLSFAVLTAGAALIAASQSAQAASATWNPNPTDGNWVATGTENNWSTGPATYPGSTTSLTNTDVATFNSTSTQTTLTINSATLDIGGITFDTNAVAYTIGAGAANSGNSLLLSSGGTIQIASTFAGTGITETFNAPLVLEPSGGTSGVALYTFTNLNTTASNVLNFAGNISGGTTTSGDNTDGRVGNVDLTLGGANTGSNTISGLISDGGSQAATPVSGRGLGIIKTGAGTWYLTNNSNSFTGGIEVSGGILNVSSVANAGVASAIGAHTLAEDTNNGGNANDAVGILINGGTLQYTGSTAQSTNRNLRLGTNGTNNNFIDASGSNVNATLSFTHTGANANLFQASTNNGITLTGTNTGLNFFDISITGGGGIVKTGTGTWVIAPEVADASSSSFSGGTTINAGTLIAGAGDSSTTAGVFGGSSRTVTLGATSGTANASLLNAGFTVGEAITVRSGSSGVETIGSSTTTAGTFSGNVALGTGVTLQGFAGGQINLSGVISGGQAVTVGSTGNTGVVNLSNVDTYSGATNVNFGTLQVSGSGSINNTTGITVNGSTAEYLQTSSVASTRAITLTQGILDGTGTVGAVTVGNGTGGIVQNGNGTSATLTLGSLTFSGTGTANLIESAAASTTVGRLNVTGALTAPGTVTLNLSGTFANGTNDLISYGSFGANTSLSDFTLGTITGLNSRQAAGSLSLSGNNIILTVTGDSPKWTGANDNRWTTASTAPNYNWRLITSGTPTDFLTNDTVLFDDTATGTTAINISDANVSVSGVTFNNSTLTYSVSSTGGFGITGAGGLTKTGTGLVTLNTTNTYTGGTTVNAGTLTGTATGAFGTSFVTVNPTGTAGTSADAATLNSTGSIASTAAVTVNSNSATAIGTINLNGATPTIGSLAGTGNVVLNNSAGTVLTIGSTNNLSGSFSGVISEGSGSSSIVKAGTGTETLGGANTYTGSTTINAGTLTLGNAQAIGAPTTASVIFGSGTSGTLQLNGNNVTVIDLTTNATTPGAAVIQSGSGTAGTDVLTVNTANTDTYAGVLQNGGTRLLGLTKGGTGTLTLTGTNTYTGGTAVNGGTLATTDNVNAFGTNGSGTSVSIGSAGTVLITSGQNNTYSDTFGGSGLLKFNFGGNSDTIINNFNAFNGTLEIGSANGGSQKLQINTAQPTALSSATLQIDNGGQFFTGGNVTFGTINLVGAGNGENRGAIRLTGNGSTTGIIGGNVFLQGNTTIGNEGGTLTGNISTGVAGTSTLTMGTGSSTGTALLSGALSNGTGTLALTTANGTTTLTGTSTYTGVTTINSGSTLQLGNGTTGNDGTIAGTSGITDNGTLIYNRLGNLSSDRVISGTGAVTVTGTSSSSQALTGTNTYTGPTLVNSGTLLVNGNNSAATGTVTVGNGTTLNGTLGGTGTVGGATTVNAGSTITGATNGAIGALTLASTLAINGTYLVDIATGVNNSDRLALSGALTLGGSSALTLSTASLDGTSTYILATYASETGQFATTNVPGNYQLTYNPMELDLTPLGAVPEPSTWLGGALCVGAFGWSLRRRLSNPRKSLPGA